MGMGKHIINLCLNTDMHTGRYLERLGQSVLVLSRGSPRRNAGVLRDKRKPKFTGK